MLFAGGSSTATGINLLGQAVGRADVSGIPVIYTHAFRTGPNLPIVAATDDLGTLGGNTSNANAINTSGQVAGESQFVLPAADPSRANFTHAFRSSATGTVPAVLADLGTLPNGNSSLGYAINASGQVAGRSNFSQTAGQTSYYHAYVTTPGGVITAASDIGSLGGNFSQARGINDAGAAVGVSTIAGDQISHAFLYTDGSNAIAGIPTGMVDLNNYIDPSLGFTLTAGYSINSLKQIAGYGTNAAGRTHAFLLTLPEPTALLALAAGGTALLGRRRG